MFDATPTGPTDSASETAVVVVADAPVTPIPPLPDEACGNTPQADPAITPVPVPAETCGKSSPATVNRTSNNELKPSLTSRVRRRVFHKMHRKEYPRRKWNRRPESLTAYRIASADQSEIPKDQIAKRALTVARRMNTVGWCLRGVAVALSPIGVHLHGTDAWQAKAQFLHDKRFRTIKIDGAEHLRPGDILVHEKSKSHHHGHIAVYLGNEQEASDHVQRVIVNGTYTGCTVFRSTQVAL